MIDFSTSEKEHLLELIDKKEITQVQYFNMDANEHYYLKKYKFKDNSQIVLKIPKDKIKQYKAVEFNYMNTDSTHKVFTVYDSDYCFDSDSKLKINIDLILDSEKVQKISQVIMGILGDEGC